MGIVFNDSLTDYSLEIPIKVNQKINVSGCKWLVLKIYFRLILLGNKC